MGTLCSSVFGGTVNYDNVVSCQSVFLQNVFYAFIAFAILIALYQIYKSQPEINLLEKKKSSP